jgi:peptidoglycan/xylan/chitin deacetylase (PgdA/CDA1 family)
VISIDLDSAAVHLAGYGIRRSGPDHLLATAIPRLREVLSRHRATATFFVVAGDRSSAVHDLVAELSADGHEIASHSLTHPMPLSTLASERLRDEVHRSRALLEDTFSVPVVGFRAPNWDTGPRVWDALAAAGYRYDASVLPTPLLLAIRSVLALKARRVKPLVAMRPWPASLRTVPHRVELGGDAALWQFPMSVGGFLRLPLYHTVRMGMNDRTFARHLDRLADAGRPFTYALHAIDATSMRDEIDDRLARHPGATDALDAKLGLIDRTLAAISARYRFTTYATHLQRLESRRPEVTGR